MNVTELLEAEANHATEFHEAESEGKLQEVETRQYDLRTHSTSFKTEHVITYHIVCIIL